MPERKSRRKIHSDDFPKLEEEMYEALRPWGEAHVDKPGSGITLIKYKPSRYPEQRIEEYVTDAWTPLDYPGIPETLRMNALRRLILARAIGSNALAKELVSDFKSISSSVADMIDDGKNIAFVPAHKHYADIGIGVGGLAVAMGGKKYIKNNIYQSVNKLMAIEKYRGKRIARFTTLTGKILWVIPSEGAAKYGVSSRAMYAVGTGGAEALSEALEDPDNGILFSVALTGGAMDEIRDENNELTAWKFRKIPDGLGASMKSFDAAIPFAYDISHEGVPIWEVGDILLPPEKTNSVSEDDHGKIFTDSIYQDLKARMERLTGLPVNYDRLMPAIEAGSLATRESLLRSKTV